MTTDHVGFAIWYLGNCVVIGGGLITWGIRYFADTLKTRRTDIYLYNKDEDA